MGEQLPPTATQPSAPEPAPVPQQPPPASPRRPPGWLVLCFALAALAASWNPIAAPFGLVVGVVTVVLAIRAFRRSTPRRLAATALVLSVLAVVASVLVIALTAGTVGVDLPGDPVVKGRTQAELDQVLSEAAERTRARRERATQELEGVRSRAQGAHPPGSGAARGGDAGDRDADAR